MQQHTPLLFAPSAGQQIFEIAQRPIVSQNIIKFLLPQEFRAQRFGSALNETHYKTYARRLHRVRVHVCVHKYILHGAQAAHGLLTSRAVRNAMEIVRAGNINAVSPSAAAAAWHHPTRPGFGLTYGHQIGPLMMMMMMMFFERDIKRQL